MQEVCLYFCSYCRNEPVLWMHDQRVSLCRPCITTSNPRSQTAAGEPQRPVGESRGLGFSCSRGPGEEPTRDICPKQGEFMLSSTCSHESEPYLCPVWPWENLQKSSYKHLIFEKMRAFIHVRSVNRFLKQRFFMKASMPMEKSVESDNSS